MFAGDNMALTDGTVRTRIFQLDFLGPSVIAPNVAPQAIKSVFFSNDVQNGNAARCQGTARGLRKAMGESTSGRQKDMSDEAVVMERGEGLDVSTEVMKLLKEFDSMATFFAQMRADDAASKGDEKGKKFWLNVLEKLRN